MEKRSVVGRVMEQGYVTIKGQHEGLWGDNIVLYPDCGDGCTNYTCVKLTDLYIPKENSFTR